MPQTYATMSFYERHPLSGENLPLPRLPDGSLRWYQDKPLPSQPCPVCGKQLTQEGETYATPCHTAS